MYTRYYFGAMLLLLAILAPQHSRAQYDPEHVYQIINHNSGLSLQIANDAAGSGQEASLAAYTGKATQQWRIIDIGNGFYELVNRNTGMALEPGGIASQAYWAQDYPPKQTPFSSTNDGHKWIIRTRSSNSALKTITSFKSGLSLSWQKSTFNTSADPQTPIPTKLGQNVDFGLDVTEWGIIDQSANYYNQVAGASYLIVNRYSGKVLGTIQGNNGVSQGQARGLAGQQWNFSSYNSAGFLTIKNRLTQEVMEIGGGGDNGALGHNANTYQYWGGNNQQWILQDVTDSHTMTVDELMSSSFKYFRIYNRYSGKVLQVAGAGNDLYRESQPANQWEWLGHPWQQWYIMYWNANRALPTTLSTEAVNQGLTVHPNPAHDRLALSGISPATITSIRVADMSGKTASVRHDANGTVDVSGLASGLYIITIQAGEKQYHQKFVKE